MALTAWCVTREMRRPATVSATVREEGYRILLAELAKYRASSVGRTRRGVALAGRLDALLASRRVDFSAHLNGPRAITVDTLLGRPVIYIKVLELADGRALHQTNWQIIESALHETLHVEVGGRGAAGLEEECDAFVAGAHAELVSRGEPIPEVVFADGMPLADFVRKAYPSIRTDPDYQPLLQTRQWLERKSGLLSSAASPRGSPQ